MSHALKQVFNKDKTFRPKRKFEPGTQRFELHKKAQASLNAGLDLKVAVQLPPGEEQNDWVAVHVVDFFNRINLIYGTISDYCTEQSCPVMSGGPKYEYRWQDEHKYRKPTALSAPQYMNLLMDWIEVQINNEDIFPTNVGEFGCQLGLGAGSWVWSSCCCSRRWCSTADPCSRAVSLCASQVGTAVSSWQLFCGAEIPRAVPDPTGSHGYLEAEKQEAALRAVRL